MFNVTEAFAMKNKGIQKLPEGSYDATVVSATAYEDDPEKKHVIRMRLNVDVNGSTQYVTHWLRAGETPRALAFFFGQLEILGVDKRWIKNHSDAGLTAVAQCITDECPDVILTSENYEWNGEIRTQYRLNKR